MPGWAADWEVSPKVSFPGSGTSAQPYDLATALSGRVGKAGDTFWLRGGDYHLGHIATTIHGAPGRVTTFRPLPGAKARVDGSLTFFDSIGQVVLRDLELFSSDTNRISRQLGMGLSPTDIHRFAGVACYAPNFSFINLIVHDQIGQGFYLSQTASNTLVYGCVVYNNGWISADDSEGHNFYVQSEGGAKEISDNLAFNNCGANFHIYENAPGGYLAGVTLDGNVAFNAGALQRVRAYRDWLVGVDWPALDADSIVFKNNMGYLAPGSPTHTQVQIGREGINGQVVLTGNYMPLGLLLNNWTIATCSSNLFAPLNSDYMVDFQQPWPFFSPDWDKNSYCRPISGNDFRINSSNYSFSDWTETGFDAEGSYVVGRLTGSQVFVRSNRYETGRAHLVVYNWEHLSSVAADVGAVLPLGTPYEVRNAQDFFAPPVLSGTFRGERLQLPMTGLTVARPSGPLLAPPPTGPTFNVFVLLPETSRLRLTIEAGEVKILWPTNEGNYFLQSKESLSTMSRWTFVTNTPTVFKNRYMVRDSLTGSQKFYRLVSEND